jgi:hypothetical protein
MKYRTRCVRFQVIALSMDNETVNFRLQEALNACPEFGVLPMPDAVHLIKLERNQMCNWWVCVEGCRFNLVMLRVLRQDKVSKISLVTEMW